MTNNEFISLIKTKGATIFPPDNKIDIKMVNTTLQDMRIAILPVFLQDLYINCSGITLGSGCIFGPSEIDRGIKYPLPSIVQINKDLMTNKILSGKTVFGRNDLFLFTFDAFGNCFMHDNITMTILRKYDDPYRAMTDCLIIGKI